MKTQKTILNALALMVMVAPFAVFANDTKTEKSTWSTMLETAGKYARTVQSYVDVPASYILNGKYGIYAGLNKLDFKIGEKTISERFASCRPDFVTKAWNSEFLKTNGKTLATAAVVSGLVYGAYKYATAEDKKPVNVIDPKVEEAQKVELAARKRAEQVAQEQAAKLEKQEKEAVKVAKQEVKPVMTQEEMTELRNLNRKAFVTGGDFDKSRHNQLLVKFYSINKDVAVDMSKLV